MKRLRSAYEQYLTRIERLNKIQLGTDANKKKSRPITEEDNQYFIKLLDKQLKFNLNIVIIYITMLCVLFGIGVFLVFYYLNSPRVIGLIFGGTFFSLLTVIEKLRRLWHEKSIIDISLTVIQELPPKETAKVIEILYWNSIRKPNKSK